MDRRHISRPFPGCCDGCYEACPVVSDVSIGQTLLDEVPFSPPSRRFGALVKSTRFCCILNIFSGVESPVICELTVWNPGRVEKCILVAGSCTDNLTQSCSIVLAVLVKHRPVAALCCHDWSGAVVF